MSSDKKFESVNNLENWMTAESRGSPDGGDDVSKSNDYAKVSKVSPY